MGVAGRSVDGLADDLAALGVSRGDAVMVHASLRAIGPVEGRAAGVVEALDRAVGPAGTVLMVLGAADDWDWVNDRPEEQRTALLADAEPFDAAVTPAEADVGALAEVFRTTSGTVVSDHPEARFGARGKLAAALTEAVPWDDYYGRGSPLDRLVEARGKVLRLGADPDTVTLTHHAEALVDLPGKRRVRRARRVVGTDDVVWVDTLEDSHGIADWDGDGDYFPPLLADYLATGRARTGRVGDADSDLLDAADYVTFAVDWLSEHLRPDP
jgi:aminoglycoside N3'-acetyltransferase